MPSVTGYDKKDGRTDPFIGLNFWVEIGGIAVAGFAECSGLTIETEMFEYAEGGNNEFVYKLPVRTKFGNVVLKRGIDNTGDLYNWFQEAMDGKIAKRRNVSIFLYDQATGAQSVGEWHVMGAYPVKWTGPDLKTDGATTTIESIEFAHHGVIPMPRRN